MILVCLVLKPPKYCFFGVGIENQMNLSMNEHPLPSQENVINLKGENDCDDEMMYRKYDAIFVDREFTQR